MARYGDQLVTYLLKSICALPYFRRHANQITVLLLAVLLRWTATIVACVVFSFQVHVDYVLHIFICVAINLHSDVFYTFVSPSRRSACRSRITSSITTRIQTFLSGCRCKYPVLRQLAPTLFFDHTQHAFIDDKFTIIPDYAEPTRRSVGTSCSVPTYSPRGFAASGKADGKADDKADGLADSAPADDEAAWQAVEMADGGGVRRRNQQRTAVVHDDADGVSPIEWEVVDRAQSDESRADVAEGGRDGDGIVPPNGIEVFDVAPHF